MHRSLLFVPSNEKMLSKISTLSADIFVIDLEDSIKDEGKDDALKILCNYLKEHNISNIYVRLNKNRFVQEASALDGFNVGFMLPKFECVEEYQESGDIWSRHKIIALIESPKAIVNLLSISSCSWVDSLAFGAEDFTANMNMENNDNLLLFYKSTLITYAKAFSKKVFDTPSFSLSDQEKFEREVKMSVALGFDGKLLINPKHLGFINSSFGKNDLEHLKYIVMEYEKKGEAVVVIEGNVYEKMHINRFRKILNENKYI